MNVVAVLLVFISAVSQRDPPLAPVQLLWVNLIMDTMGALALGTEQPSMKLLDRKPYVQSASIIRYVWSCARRCGSCRSSCGLYVRSNVMWRNILCQSMYQLAITLFLVYDGADAFDIDAEYLDKHDFNCLVSEYVGTFVFNTFVLCQVCMCEVHVCA